MLGSKNRDGDNQNQMSQTSNSTSQPSNQMPDYMANNLTQDVEDDDIPF
jgi:single-stranded DNA-binding protein